MKNFEIVYMDGYDQVCDYDTGEIIFSTKGMEPSFIDNVVIIWNKTKSPEINLWSGGVLDDYLLDEGACTTEQKELIVESLYLHAVK